MARTDSHWPDPASELDKPRDLLREAFASFDGKLPATIEEFRAVAFGLIDKAIEAGGEELKLAGSNVGAQTAVAQMLQLMTRDIDPRTRMKAYCYLRLLGIEGRSFQELGDELGVRRATVHKCYREIQERTGLPGRGDKSPIARQKYRDNRIGKRRQRSPWAGLSVWKNLLAAA